MLAPGGWPCGVYFPSTGKFREIEGIMKLKLLRTSFLLAILAFPAFPQNQPARIPGDRNLMKLGAARLAPAAEKDGLKPR